MLRRESGAYAVFTEQGSSAALMTAAKIMDAIETLPDCDGQAADAVSAYTVENWRMIPESSKFQNQNVQMIGYVFHDTKWTKSLSNIEDLVVPLERNLYGHPLAGLLWEGQFEEVLLEFWMGENSGLGMYVRPSETRIVLVSLCGCHQHGWTEPEYGSHVEEIDEKCGN